MNSLNVNTNINLLWGTKAIAKYLHINTRRAQYLCEQNAIPAQKVGGRWVVSEEDLQAQFITTKRSA